MARKQKPPAVNDLADESSDDTLGGRVQIDPLYDYLYRDQSRIDSYYAQLFSGRLRSSEETSSSRNSRELTGRLNAGVMGGDDKGTTESTTTQRRMLDPHDLALTELLSYLSDNGCITRDIIGAPNGSLISATGTVFFIENSMLKIATAAFETLLNNTLPSTDEERLEHWNSTLGLGMMQQTTLPSCFMMNCEGDLTVCGTVKDSGMDEPINSYYYRHGPNGLPDVRAIGIKESSTAVDHSNGGFLLTAVGPLAQLLQSLVFPNADVRITPIAIFRVVDQTIPRDL